MMPHQTSLFDGSEPEPVHNHTKGSKRAARAIRPVRVSQRDQILSFIDGRGDQGATRNEIADWLGVALASVCPRVSELQGFPCRKGKLTRPVLIRAAAFTRENSSGIAVEVLVVV